MKKIKQEKQEKQEKKGEKLKKGQKVHLEPRSFFEQCNSFLDRYEMVWFWVLFAITLLTSFLLYDPRVSPGGDDSGYILSAHDFLRQHKFPAFQAPLYPMVLSVIDLFFGMSLSAFKIFSICCILAFVALTFFAYRRQVPSLLLFITLLLTSINSHVLYFASQTYSEAFYMMMQSLLPLVFFKIFINSENTDILIASRIRRNLLLGITIVGIVMSRNIGYAALLTVVAWFVCYRQWMNAGRAVIYFTICMASVQLLKMMIWKNTVLQGSEQLTAFLFKDFYHPEFGKETIFGFFERFWINSNQYLSRFFMAMLGFRDSITSEGYFSPVKPPITILTYLLGVVGLFLSFRKNKALFFASLFAGISVVISFFILHAFWNQERLIATAFPLLIMLLFGALYYFLNLRHFRKFQILFMIPFAFVFFLSLSDTSKAVAKAQKLSNEYSELTPDWRNYLMASTWAGKNLSDSSLVACRQPAISSVYAKGKKFYRLGRVNSSNFQTFLNRWSSGENYAAVALTNLPNDIYVFLMRYYVARTIIDETHYMIVENSETLRNGLSQWQNIKPITSLEKFKALCSANSQLSVYYADSLLQPLRQAKVTHFLTASLRLNPYIKDGKTINTVERTAIFIQEKYPNIFTLVKNFGDENEPANIFQINWEVIKN